MPSVVGAKALHQPRLARIAILPQPRIPAAARAVRRGQQLLIAGQLRQLPRRGGDGHHHLNLPEAVLRCLHARRQLAVWLLQLEERHVIVAGRLNRSRARPRPRSRPRLRPGQLRPNVLGERGVDQPFVRTALLPDALIRAAFKQNGPRVAGDAANVACEHGDGRIPCALPGCICGRKCRRIRLRLRSRIRFVLIRLCRLRRPILRKHVERTNRERRSRSLCDAGKK